MQMIAQIRSVSLALAPDVSTSWAAMESEEASEGGGGGHRGVKWAKGKGEEGINSQWHACEYAHTHTYKCREFLGIGERLRYSLA